MVETLQHRNGLWHIVLARDDLIKQAGLNEKDLETDLMCLRYKGRTVIISHEYRKELVVSMEGKEDEDLRTLIGGFSKVVGYKPSCKYNLRTQLSGKNPGSLPFYLPTYEWDKVDPKKRFNELKQKKSISDLVRI